MKIIFSIILFFCTANAYSQKITYHSLIGKWNVIDSSGNGTYIHFKFFNKSKGELNMQNIPVKFKYSINNSAENSLITMRTVTDDKINHVIYFLIKPDGENIFKIQYVESPETKEWNKNENERTTGGIKKE